MSMKKIELAKLPRLANNRQGGPVRLKTLELKRNGEMLLRLADEGNGLVEFGILGGLGEPQSVSLRFKDIERVVDWVRMWGRHAWPQEVEL